MLKAFFEYIKLNWGYFSTLLAVGSFIWTLGVKSERKIFEKVNIKENIVEVQKVQKQQSEQLDSIYAIIDKLRIKQSQIIDNQNSLRQSYVNYVSNDKSLKLNDFLKYMDGLEFEIAPIEGAAKPDFKIGIKKIEQQK